MNHRSLSRCAVAGGVVLVLVAFAGTASAQARDPSPDELKAARELFQEAFNDEQSKHFDIALEKFRRVAAVKESASVRYRIASVLESLGRLREGRDAFRAIVAAKATLPANQVNIADSSAERANALDKKIPRLLLRLQDNAPPDTRVVVDGAAVPVSTTVRPLELDPGEHVVQATASGARMPETKVALAEGTEISLIVTLSPEGPSTPVGPQPVPPAARKDNTLAYVALGAGGVLLITGVVLLAVRSSDISSLESSCPNGACPAGSDQPSLESKRDQASLFGPLGVGAGVLGLAAAGAGVYLLLRPAPAAASAGSSGLRLTPRMAWGGAMVGLDTTF